MLVYFNNQDPFLDVIGDTILEKASMRSDHMLMLYVVQAANAASIAIRFVNNVIGGMQFIDMARWTGVQ